MVMSSFLNRSPIISRVAVLSTQEMMMLRFRVAVRGYFPGTASQSLPNRRLNLVTRHSALFAPRSPAVKSWRPTLGASTLSGS